MCFEKSRASEATVEHAVELLVQFGESFTILRTLGCRYKIMRIDDPFVPPCTCTPVLVHLQVLTTVLCTIHGVRVDTTRTRRSRGST